MDTNTKSPSKKQKFSSFFWTVIVGILLAAGILEIIQETVRYQHNAYGYRYYVIDRPGWTDTFNCTDYGEYFNTQEDALKAATQHIHTLKSMVADSNLLIVGGPFIFKAIKPNN